MFWEKFLFESFLLNVCASVANFVEKVIFGFGEAKNIFGLEVEFSVNFSAGLTY